MADNSVAISHAQTALDAWHKVADDGANAQLRDLLADLMHHCAANGIDFDHELSMATDFFSDEKGEEK